MSTYVLYKIGKTAETNASESVQRIMSNDDIDALRVEANRFYAQHDNLIGRKDEQLHIDSNSMCSNIVVTKAGDSEYHRYIEIREIQKRTK